MSKKEFWICGYHTVLSALSSKKKKILKVISSKKINLLENKGIKYEIVTQSFFKKIFTDNIAHQGIAAKVIQLGSKSLKDYIKDYKIKNIVMLNGITDTRNIGSIIRSALLFNFDLIIVKDREFDEKNYYTHKAASGALEHIDICTVKNLSNAVDILKENNFWISVIDISGSVPAAKHNWDDKNLIVLGSEEYGVSQNIINKSDFKIRVDMKKTEVDSLNISNLASCIFFDVYNKNQSKSLK